MKLRFTTLHNHSDDGEEEVYYIDDCMDLILIEFGLNHLNWNCRFHLLVPSSYTEESFRGGDWGKLIWKPMIIKSASSKNYIQHPSTKWLDTYSAGFWVDDNIVIRFSIGNPDIRKAIRCPFAMKFWSNMKIQYINTRYQHNRHSIEIDSGMMYLEEFRSLWYPFNILIHIKCRDHCVGWAEQIWRFNSNHQTLNHMALTTMEIYT